MCNNANCATSATIHKSSVPHCTDSCSSRMAEKDVLDKTVHFLQKREGIDKVHFCLRNTE
jgi:hypothetical protein